MIHAVQRIAGAFRCMAQGCLFATTSLHEVCGHVAVHQYVVAPR